MERLNVKVARLWLSMVAATFYTSVSFADSQLGTHWQSIVGTLLSQGVNRVGKLDLVKFEQQAKGIRWGVAQGDPPAIARGRRSAYYLTATKQVFVYPEASAQASDAIGMLELHEALSVLGYADADYALSSSLVTLAKLKANSARAQVVDKMGKSTFLTASSRILRSGGSSVGGGGDLTSLVVKHSVLEKVLVRGSGITIAFLAGFPRIAFEPNYQKGLNKIGLQYQGNDSKGRLVDRITLHIPIREWNRGGRTQKALIEQALNMSISLFPAYDNTPQSDVVALGCGKKNVVKFPRVQDTQVDLVQQARAALLTHCDDSFGIAEIRPSELVTYGDLAGQAEQAQRKNRDPSRSAFDCTMSLGKIKKSYPHDIPMGYPTFSIDSIPYASRRGAYTADTLLSVNVYSLGDGRIMQISYVEMRIGEDGKVLKRSDQKISAGARPVLQTKTVSGETLKYECEAI